MPGAKGLNPHELAHKWVKDLGTRPNMSIKTGTSAVKQLGFFFCVLFTKIDIHNCALERNRKI